MDFQPIAQEASHGDVTKFWQAMGLWLKSPHLINRRISSSVNLWNAVVKGETADILAAISRIDIGLENWQLDANNLEKIFRTCTPVTEDPLQSNREDSCLLVHKFLPRDSSSFSWGIEFSLVDKESNQVFCYHRSGDKEKRFISLNRIYKISFDAENRLAISVEKKTNDECCEGDSHWLRDRLFPRLFKWLQNDRAKDSLVQGSLNLVSPEEYTNLYDELKKKYGTEMVKKWPECTDPSKFVYEDVAIAAYLILLWRQERNHKEGKKQSFVDLGCGNGLLVYILTEEGHPGTGIDLRKRQIWDIYPPTTNLIEKTIVPSASSIFPEVDWLIGNHSDELTAWIPVMAARSSYTCRYFLLPCCAHEFDGRKYQRDCATKSQYSEFLEYVKGVSEACGFETDVDKLRIPSTKRICLIGRGRTYPKDKSLDQDKIIEATIRARSSRAQKDFQDNENPMELENQWSPDFKPRDRIEKVRNCTQVDPKIIDEVVKIVADDLLRKVRGVTVDDEKIWNAGGQIELANLAKILPPEILRQLKNECGGLQTLIRNNGHIFRVVDGTVQFKVPGSQQSSKKKGKKRNFVTKTKACWFHSNHPDGCPLSDQLCTFKH